jgi:PilZ domain
MTLEAASSLYVDYAIAALEDRSAPRYRFAIAAQLRPSGITGFNVVVTNLSLSGFACEAVTGIPAGSRCWLTLPGLAPLQAEVVRNDGLLVGCAFSNLLSQFVFDSIVQKHGILEPQY